MELGKTARINQQRQDQDKLLKDFEYVMNSDLNDEFKRIFINRFIDSWVGSKMPDGKATTNYWSRKAIEKLISNAQNTFEIEGNYPNLNSKEINQDIQTDHLIPKAFFEDIFIDFKILSELKTTKTARIQKASEYFNLLKRDEIQSTQAFNQQEFLKKFFNKHCITVRLEKSEHNNLKFSSEMPDEFYDTRVVWNRYTILKRPELGTISVHEIDLEPGTHQNFNWGSATPEHFIKATVFSPTFL